MNLNIFQLYLFMIIEETQSYFTENSERLVTFIVKCAVKSVVKSFC